MFFVVQVSDRLAFDTRWLQRKTTVTNDAERSSKDPVSARQTPSEPTHRSVRD